MQASVRRPEARGTKAELVLDHCRACNQPLNGTLNTKSGAKVVVKDWRVCNAGWSLLAADAPHDEFVRMRGYNVASPPSTPRLPPP